jgi:hypothetical protein
VGTIESAVEAAVRAAYEAWLGPDSRSTDLLQEHPTNHPRASRRSPTVRSSVVGWDAILRCADAAADIGPQIRAELARAGLDGAPRTPQFRRRHPRRGRPAAAA